MENLTEIQDNPFEYTDLENLPNIESSSYKWTTRDYIKITMHLTRLILCLVNISASIFVMVIIMRFKKLKTRVNIYFFHYALNNAMYYLSEPIVYILIFILDVFLDYYPSLICCLLQLDDSCLVLLFVFPLFAALDYYLNRLTGRMLFLYKNMYKYFIFILYNIGVIMFLISIINCFSIRIHVKHHIILTAVFLAVFISMSVINFLEYRERRKGIKQDRIRYSLIVANVIIVCWTPLFLYDVFVGYFDSINKWDHGHMIINFIPEFLAHGHCILVVYLLGRLDKNFKMAYTIALKKRFRNYDHNDLDQSEDESAVHHQVNGYNKTTAATDESVNTEEAYSDIALR